MEKKSVAIIGGGLGGISAAISLAQSGFDVSLYEKNGHLGGKLTRAELDGFGFDLGPSILTMKHIFEKLFNNQGKTMDDYIPTVRLDLEWRSFFPDGTHLDLYGDLRKMYTENDLLSNKDMEEYNAFLNYAKKLYDVTEKGYFNEGLDNLSEIVKYHGLIEAATSFDVFSTVHEAISKYISNEKLKHVLGYFMKYVGSSPYDAPAILNMMIYMQHDQGAWYVPGGMHKIADELMKLGEEAGVTFHTDTEVSRLVTENGKITQAELADGRLIEADYFISNMEVIPAYKHLLQEDESFIEKLEKNFEPASSGFVLH